MEEDVFKKLKASIESRRRDQGSISSTFYAKLLCTQIPKEQKKDKWLDCIFCAFGIWARKSCM
jgi:hypothetical protein